MSGTLKIIVADDHPMIRMALRLGVAGIAPGARVLEVESFTALKQAVVAHPDADLVLLDLIMPGVDGFSALIYLHEKFPALRTAVVSALDPKSGAAMVRSLGAVGFIHKSARPDQMQAALRGLIAGDEAWPDPDAHVEGETASSESEAAERLTLLSPQELRILLMIRDGRVNKQIAGALEISESTVKGHVSAILRKLETTTRTQAAILAQRLLAMPDMSDPNGPDR
ncbi:MAG: LuxR C-terminal-related transcriptional regulator [Panacagrimonas sp.]